MPALPRFTLTLAALLPLLPASSQVHAVIGCEWESTTGPMVLAKDVGSFWVPRDAQIGTKIGSINRTTIPAPPGIVLVCDNDGTRILTASMNTPLPIEPGTFPPIDGNDPTGKVLKTSIPGVGLYLQLDSPVNGFADNHFIDTNGGVGAVPFVGENDKNMSPTHLRAQMLAIKYAALIKTGTIAPGVHAFNQEVVRGVLSDIGDAIRINLSGQVQQAQCTLRADAVSANPVNLGTHDVRLFQGVGSTTAAVDFHITLSDCEDDPAGSVARAFMRLDGVQGSVPLDRDRGLFSLTSDSDAKGFGIQVLRSDNTPVKLEEFVDMAALSPGLMRLDLRAQYYQTDAQVTPGLAKGALNFTINYR